MVRQRGSVKEIVKGKKYKISFYIGTDANGKRKYHVETIEAKNKAEAQKYLAKKLVEFDTGALPTGEANTTLKDYLNEWLKVKKSSVGLKTYATYEYYLKEYIIPSLGDYKIKKLVPLIIQSAYNDLEAAGLKGSTIRYIHNLLNQALEQAVTWQMINRNPCKNLVLPKAVEREMKVLTPEQARKFLEACIYDRFGVLFELLLTSGMRPSEVLGLKWEDVDWKNNRITIKRTLSRVGKTWLFKETKTKNSRRTIILPCEVMEDLKEHRKKQAQEKLEAEEYNDYGLVFACSNGNPLGITNIKQHFKALLKDTGLPDLRLYDLRHSCATLLLAAGENPKVTSERLGHSNVAITLNIYSHVLPSMQEEAAMKLENLLF
ncbi:MULTISPECIES: tyrosine-type recombinase/integrase [Thermoanaerobacterium]|uniref:Integrase family protein n=2 Tax=Thermoanaerobacterium TaxID=28895 RepID=W9EDY9_9THEO|nr:MULTISPECIES: site-specific integrase [Thermoanaerobacterium]AFK86966.1 integrase family protein [Thermoanaerobacterium saccharolyticum JW/SL-YS485]ETO39225.1 integrase family protein [Thermoanaerobacterium aotearoense SCUT27]